MVGKKLQLVVTLFVVTFTLFALLPISEAQAGELVSPERQEAGTNLLDNPGFEGIGLPESNSSPNSDNWTRTTYTGASYGEIFTPEGWVTWWQESDGYKRPECKVIPNQHPFNAEPNRIYDGYYSGMCFAFFGKQHAGYYQVVRNLPAGSVVEGSYFAHAWSCDADEPPLSCGDPHNFYFRVGIDPNGGTDPFSSNIVWSSPYYHYDEYGYVGPVQATVGEAGAATLFIESFSKWPLKHTDAYMDNAALKLVSAAAAPTATPEPVPSTPEAEAEETAEEAESNPDDVSEAPEATSTPLSNGTIVHVIESGDTLFGLAIEYGVDVQQIYDLNDLGPDSLLSIGQEVVISSTGEVDTSPEPTATPEASDEAPETPEETEGEAPPESTEESTGDNEGGGGVLPADEAPVVPAAGEAAVCVLAFHDANEDMFRQVDDGEMLLPNAEINLVGRSGPIDTRTTDGISEPWCFEGLAPGNYILRHTPPSGYQSSGSDGQISFALSEGAVWNMELGFVRDETAEPVEGSEELNEAESAADLEEEEAPVDEDEAGVTNVLNVVLRVSGFIVLALAIAVLVLFVLSRRSV